MIRSSIKGSPWDGAWQAPVELSAVGPRLGSPAVAGGPPSAPATWEQGGGGGVVVQAAAFGG